MAKRERVKSSVLFAEYFGSLQELASKPLPFKCSCGSEFYASDDIWPHLQAHARKDKTVLTKG